jgi:hypothetical protein
LPCKSNISGKLGEGEETNGCRSAQVSRKWRMDKCNLGVTLTRPAIFTQDFCVPSIRSMCNTMAVKECNIQCWGNRHTTESECLFEINFKPFRLLGKFYFKINWIYLTLKPISIAANNSTLCIIFNHSVK